MAAAGLLGLSLALAACRAPVSPVAWKVEEPAVHGFDPARLEALRAKLAAQGTASLLVAHRNAIVLEWYAPGQSQTTQHYAASIAKTLVGGLSLLLAASEGAIQLDAPAWHHIPPWKDDPQRSRITLRQLATHSSGLANRDLDADWSKRFWSREAPFAVALRETPLEAKPGERFVYSSPGFAALGYAVTSALRKQGVRDDVQELLRARITRPLGIPDAAWSMGYDSVFELDGLRLEPNWGGCGFTARALARIGQWMLDGGRFQSETLLDPTLVALAMSDQGMTDQATEPIRGLGWWSNGNRVWPSLPADAAAAIGADDQILLVVPSLDLVVVRFGRAFDDPGSRSEWTRPEPFLFRPLAEALALPSTSPSQR